MGITGCVLGVTGEGDVSLPPCTELRDELGRVWSHNFHHCRGNDRDMARAENLNEARGDLAATGNSCARADRNEGQAK